MIENEKFQEIVLDFMRTQSQINVRLYKQLKTTSQRTIGYNDFSTEDFIRMFETGTNQIKNEIKEKNEKIHD